MTYQPSFRPYFRAFSMSPTVKVIIIINLAVFLLLHVFKANWIWFFALVPQLAFARLMLWQFFTYSFVHVGLWHLVINMLMLWFFGPTIENSWGRKNFLIYFFLCALGAGLCSFIVSLRSPLPIVGASGVIFGILVAYALMYPEAVILLFFIFPMKMRYAVLILAAINLLAVVSSSGNNAAYVAQLGGGLFGYLYLKNEWLRFKISSISILKLKSQLKRKKEKRIKKLDIASEQEVNRILDKISKSGMGSLSRREKKILEQRSKEK